MKIDLKDFYLYPLNAEELSLCTYCLEKIDELLKNTIQSQLILGLSDSPQNWKWYTCWFIINISENKIIGILSFKGRPNYNGEINIGYALSEKFRKKGYMTRTVMAICSWLKQFNEVKSIIAETKIDNYSSQDLLKRCGFNQFKTYSNYIIYRKAIRASINS